MGYSREGESVLYIRYLNPTRIIYAADYREPDLHVVCLLFSTPRIPPASQKAADAAAGCHKLIYVQLAFRKSVTVQGSIINCNKRISFPRKINFIWNDIDYGCNEELNIHEQGVIDGLH